jgi:ubiquinone/menaquinone biosynthesis C-methylase UbiE
MSNWPPDWLRAYPEAVQDTLGAALSGSLDPPIVLTRLFMQLGDADAISSLLSRAESERRDAADAKGGDRFLSIRDLLSGHPTAFGKMRDVLAILHGERSHKSVDIASVAAAFDAAVELSPAASVALYSLGEVRLLASATQEIVLLLRQRKLISGKARVLEIGCGIGRFAQALADEVRSFTGTDVSKNMIRVARDRCADLPNVTFSVTSGHDLGDYSDADFDLVLAVDSFPYIVATQPGLAELHVAESARVLAPGGSLTIFNFSYEEDFGASHERLQGISHEVGLTLIAAEPTPLRSWDGSFFHLRKQSCIQ